MVHIWSSILLISSGILSRFVRCQFPQFFGQQQQWYPAQQQPQQAQWAVPWQQQQVVQQPWHHHHHEDHHHHPPPVIVHHHDDHHDDHHHHHLAHYPPIRNNANGNSATNDNQQAVIPYRQEQFSPLGIDLTEAAAAGGTSSPAEFQEQLPELFRQPEIIDQLPTDQQQSQNQQQTPNLGNGVNNAFFSHNKQQQHTLEVGNSRPTAATARGGSGGGGGAVPATQQQRQQPAASVNSTKNNNNNNNVGGGTRRRITTASVRLPAANPALIVNNNGINTNNNGINTNNNGINTNNNGINNNGINTNNNGINNRFGGNVNFQSQQQQQHRKVLLLTGPTTTAAAPTAPGGPVIGKAKGTTKRPSIGNPPAIAPPKHGGALHSQAVPAKEAAIVRELDLPPPPPPSRFLPDVEKLRIEELLRQKATHHTSRHDVDSEDIHSDDELTKLPTVLTTISSISSTTEAATTTVTTVTVRPTMSTLARLTSTGVPLAKNFEVLSKKILTALFLNTDKCPSENGLELFTCAAQDSDHTECCKTKRVQRTAAGNKCLAFCNLSPDAPRVQADASYLPCWAVLNEIKNCFREKLAATLQV